MLNRRNLGKTSIMVIAIAASISLTVTMLSLSNGIRNSSRGTLDDIEAEAYVVPEDINPLLKELQRFDSGRDVLEEIEESGIKITNSSTRLRAPLFFKKQEKIGEVITYGVIPEDEGSFGQFNLVDGRWFTKKNDPFREEYIETGEKNRTKFTNDLLVSEQFKRDHDVEIGEKITLTASVRGGFETVFEVVGIFEDTLSRKEPQLMIHLGELQYITGMLESDTVSEILLSLEGGENELIEWSQTEEFRYRDIVDIHSKGDILSEIYRFMDVVNGFSVMVILVTVLVSGIFLSTLLMIAAKQSSKDLAVLRTIGFPSWKVSVLLLRESVIVTILGSILGVTLGLLLNNILNSTIMEYFESLPSSFNIFVIDTVVILSALMIYLIMSLLSGLLPAIVSSTRPPMEALRGEGI